MDDYFRGAIMSLAHHTVFDRRLFGCQGTDIMTLSVKPKKEAAETARYTDILTLSV
jgi:hypothetical protein